MIIGQLVSESYAFCRSCSNLGGAGLLFSTLVFSPAARGRCGCKNLDFQDVTMSVKCPRMSAAVAEYIYFEMSANTVI